MANIKFNYLYRDKSNLTKNGKIIFFNPHGLSLDAATSAIQNALWKKGLFTAHQIRIPEVFLFVERDATSDDHCFHEFEGVELSDEVPTDRYGRTMSEFVSEVIREAKEGWRVFDPLDRLLCR